MNDDNLIAGRHRFGVPAFVVGFRNLDVLEARKRARQPFLRVAVRSFKLHQLSLAATFTVDALGELRAIAGCIKALVRGPEPCGARNIPEPIMPAIFGTLFERSLDPVRRSLIGAHYTSEADILLIVEPVVIQPIRARWEKTKASPMATSRRASIATFV
jgi:hypothetical protein